VALPFATLSSFAVVAANRFHSSPYRTTVGSFSGDSSKDPVVGLLNPRMLSKLSSQKMAGISVENERFDRLVSVILDNKPDVLFLPEMNRFAASALAAKLKENYHYIFTGMGEKILGEDTSFFVAFRWELQAAPEYIPFLVEQGFVSKTSPGSELKTSLTYEHYHGTEEGLAPYEPFFFVKNIENMADVVPVHSEEKLSEALSDHALILHR